MISWHFQILKLKKIFSMKQIESQYTSIKRKKKKILFTLTLPKKKKKNSNFIKKNIFCLETIIADL